MIAVVDLVSFPRFTTAIFLRKAMKKLKRVFKELIIFSKKKNRKKFLEFGVKSSFESSVKRFYECEVKGAGEKR